MNMGIGGMEGETRRERENRGREIRRERGDHCVLISTDGSLFDVTPLTE